MVPTTPAEKIFISAFVLVSVVVVGFSFGMLFARLTAAEEDRLERLRRSIIEDDAWRDDEKGRTRLHHTNATNRLLSPSKRSVLDAFVVLLTCLVVGMAICKYEGMSWIDGIYFSVVSCTTLGYGDISPHTQMGKLATSIFIMFGCSALAWATTNVACIPLMIRAEQKQRKYVQGIFRSTRTSRNA